MRDHHSDNLIVQKSTELGIAVIHSLAHLKIVDQEVRSQYLKAGTSVGANIREAQNGESLKDFFHKMKIAAKELDEVIYWTELIKSGYQIHIDPQLLVLVEENRRILNAILSKLRHKLNIKPQRK